MIGALKLRIRIPSRLYNENDIYPCQPNKTSPIYFANGEIREQRKLVNIKKICVLGLGYIGLPTASMFAVHGLKVLGVDINPKVIDMLNKGEIHIHEPGLRDVVTQAITSGNISFSRM